ncbi:hypothetical protein PsYK624_119860 [Phanerochaete sordida]|uniref:Proteophosphoglycan ppg4 n=1 Tax=Phanerochaete sordida TaxID=48140 RepID=A0A9P3GIZ0_9APHY|nr:hypothetical protein PsYK624_119860 [Phanerochaete sordida]
MLDSGPHSTTPLLITFFLTLVAVTNASPVPRKSDQDSGLTPVSAGLLALGLGLPFVLLASLKLLYLKYRRAHTIHHGHQVSSGATRATTRSSADALSEKARSPLVGLGLDTSSASAAFALSSGLVPLATPRRLWWRDMVSLRIVLVSVRRALQGYLVGFLGSPEWETRITVRADKVARRASLARTTPGSAHPSTFSPRSTLSRHPDTSPNLSPYLTASGFASNSVSSASRARTANSSSLNSKRGTLSSATRTRTSAAPDGSLVSRSQVSADASASHSGSGSGSRRSRRSRRRSASVSAPAGSHRASGSVSKGARSSGTHSHRQSHSSKYASASLDTHTRSLSLSFLEMGTPELGVLSGAARQEDFAKATEQALDGVSGTAATAGAGPSGLPSDLVALLRSRKHEAAGANSAINKSNTIEDCASVHPGSPPCQPLPSPVPGPSSSSRSLPLVASESSARIVHSSSSMPQLTSADSHGSIARQGIIARLQGAQSTAGSTDASPYLTPYYFSPNLIPSPASASPVQSGPMSSLHDTKKAPQDGCEGYFTLSASQSSHSQDKLPASESSSKRISVASIISSSSLRACLTLSVTSPLPSPLVPASPLDPASPNFGSTPATPLNSSQDKSVSSRRVSPASERSIVTYLSPTKSSQAKMSTKPLNITPKTPASPGMRDKTDEEIRDVKASHRRASPIGLGLSSTKTPGRLSPSPGRGRTEDTYTPSPSGCETHHRARSPPADNPSTASTVRKDSPAMPGALPLTPALAPLAPSPRPPLSPTPRFTGPKGRLASRFRKSVSGPSTPNPDEFGVNTSGERDAAKGTSSEEVEGLLVFDVGPGSSASSAGASKASSRSSRGTGTSGSVKSRATAASGTSGASRRRSKPESWASLDIGELIASDGKLDVDAVSAALGLSARLSRSSSLDVDADDDFSIEARSVRSLLADDEPARGVDADEEFDVEEQENSAESFVRPHGSQLYPIIEEDCASEHSFEGLPASARASPVPYDGLPGARPSSYVVVGPRPAAAPRAPGSALNTLGAPALADFRRPDRGLELPLLALPRSGAASVHGADTRASVCTADLRASANESVLELDLRGLQLDVPGFDFSGVSGFGEGGEGVSLFGLGAAEAESAERVRESPREEGSFSAGVGVAF